MWIKERDAGHVKASQMCQFHVCRPDNLSRLHCFLCSLLCVQAAQAPTHYEATLESLNQHPLPQWYADAKLGTFIHWGLYSVPGWVPLVHPTHDFSSQDYIRNNP